MKKSIHIYVVRDKKTKDARDPKVMGREAKKGGMPPRTNPFPKGTDEYMRWNEGYNETKDATTPGAIMSTVRAIRQKMEKADDYLGHAEADADDDIEAASDSLMEARRILRNV